MAFTLRPYQQQAVDAAIDYFRQQSHPAVIVLPTGAGKSLVIAELVKKAKGRVLVLAHVKELVSQNHSKYCAYGVEADLFSAGLQQKQSSGKVIFGSIQSVARHLSLFDTPFSLLIIDECHRISDDKQSQYQQVIQHLQQLNPQLRLLGLTATPYRLGKGWIYQYHHHGMIRGDSKALFRDCIYELPLRYLIKQGYLVAPQRLDMPILHYDFSQLLPRENGLFAEQDLNRALRKQKRITPLIVQQIIEYAQQRRGVMIFAATVEHAREVYRLLPTGQAALITGETAPQERDHFIAAFKQQQLRYLVNVAVLTTGFDAPHVDMIAILRPTESISLYQQIIGRGLRLYPDKQVCLILDYAGNPHDLFRPEVGQVKPKTDSEPVQVFCPQCGFANLFWGKCDSQGNVIEHFGRRCQSWHQQSDGSKKQCDFRFRFKICPHCGGENDIAARRCQQCEQILVDADDMLKAAMQLKDAMILRCGGMQLESGQDSKGEWLTIIYHDEDGTSVSERFRLATVGQRHIFQQQFILLHQAAPGTPFPWHQAADVIARRQGLRYPDFIIARRKGAFWQIREKLFDYQGRFRRADALE